MGNSDWENRFETLLDRQIRAAQERGEFDDLPGAGKPLPNENTPYRPDWWINQVVEREGAGAYAVPPALALRKLAEDLRGGAAGLRGEREVRAAVDDYNERAARARQLPPEGREVVLPVLEADEIVRFWRERKSHGK